MKNTKKIQRKQSNQKRTIKKKGKIYKKGGAVTDTKSEVPKEVDPSKADLETRSLEELAKIKEEREKANNEMIEDASTVAKGVIVNTLEKAGDLVGVDIDNPKAVNDKLADIKEIFTDPKNTEEIKEIVAEAAKKGAVIVEAASPLIDPLAEKALTVGSKTAEKMADAGKTIFSNLIKETPFLGLPYTLLQDASKVVEAGSSVVNATAELTTDTADSAVVFKKNLEELKKEGTESENRAAQAVKAFENPLSTPKLPIQTPESFKKGGKKSSKKSTKKNFFKNKNTNTKRVRCALY
jgi:hypothetical protein